MSATADRGIVISPGLGAPRELGFEAGTEVRPPSPRRGTRRSRSTTRSRAASRPWTSWPRTSPTSLGGKRRTDGRQGVLQRVDVAGRLHRARIPRGADGPAVDGTAAVGVPAAVLPGESQV